MIFIYIFLSTSSILYSQTKKDVPIIINDKPKFQKESLLTLKELYKIPIDVYDEYQINKIYSMDVDSDTNLYVLDPFLVTITVFNKNGKYLRTMGGRGQGPNELIRSLYLYIYDDKIFINQSHLGIKVWDLTGKYITEYKNVFRNQVRYIIRPNYILTCDELVDSKNLLWKYELQRLSLKFNDKKILAEIDNKKKSMNEVWEVQFLFGIDSKENIYFVPERNEYKINIYNLDGVLLKTFGRKYKLTKISKEILDIRKKYKFDAITKVPQVIQYIIIDNKDYVWVVPAWSSLELMSFKKIPADIDIFNSTGEYLYTFNHLHVVPGSIIRNNRLYSLPDEETDRNIRVFQIEYNNKLIGR